MDSDKQLDFSLVLANSVHDMKNSLGMLLNSLEAMIHASPPRDDEEAKRFAVLQYEAARINNDLMQLLAIYRLQDNLLPLHIDEHYVCDTLEEQLARNEMLFEMRELTVTLDCDPDLVWFYDQELIGGIVNNIMVNCSRYTDAIIAIKAWEEEGQLVISVLDDGPGYPPAMLKAPGEPIGSVDFSAGSTSLGLFFADQIARRHLAHDRRGCIALRNRGELRGGEFRLYLP